jgi:hypothetical protein
MSHFLARLVERARGTAPRVEPIIAPRFAPAPQGEISEEVTMPPLLGEFTDEVSTLTRATPLEMPPGTPANPAPHPHARQETSSATPFEVAEDDSTEMVRETLLLPSETPELPPAPAARQRKSTTDKTVLPKRPALAPQPQRRLFIQQTTREPRSLVSAHSPAVPNESISEPPIVRVTIGRIDVRATSAPAAPTRKTPPPSAPKLTLDAYLKARKEGAR